MRQLAEIIGSVTERPARIAAKPEITQDTYRLVADISKLRSLGYTPRMDLVEGVRQLAQEMGERPALPGSETIFLRGQQGESW